MDLEILSSEDELVAINGGGIGKAIKDVLKGIGVNAKCITNNCNCPNNTSGN
jgi:hypothetical protein